MITSTINKKAPVLIYHSESRDAIATQFLFVKRRSTADPALSLEDYEYPCFVNNLSDAKSYLQKIQLSDLPELILIDLPLNLAELTTFKNWLSESYIPSIPIIYNETCLNQGEIRQLFQLNLIDDVIKNDQNTSLLQEKVRFFKSLSVQSLIEPTPLRKAEKSSTPLYRKIIKRSIDISISLSVLIALSPLLLLTGILIKLTSKGPIVYKSKRAGKGFTIFNFYKFRTMISGAEEMLDSLSNKNLYNSSDRSPSFFKVSNDPRITKIGLFLRNTSLDELPQLLNVLKGDMSLVGNRPLPLYEAATLTTPEFAERFMAPAGITGLWQISKRGKPKMSAEERIALDIAYARTVSTRRDLKILFSTPSALFQKQNQ